MKSINKITSFIDKVCVFAGVCLLIFIAGSIAAQVVVRKLGGSMFWVDEMTRYAFIWLVLFGTVDLARKGDISQSPRFWICCLKKWRKLQTALFM